MVETQTITTGFFGKLPKFADFVKMNASGNEISMIDDWIQEGLAISKLKYKNEWKNFYDNAPGINFVFPFTGTDKIILGILKPSKDKSGRSFPFIMFAIIHRNMVSGLSSHLIAPCFGDLFLFLNSLIQNNFENDDLNELRTSVNNFILSNLFQNSIADLYQKYIAEQSIKNVFNASEKYVNTEETSFLNDLVSRNLDYLESSEGLSFSFSADHQNEHLNLSFVTEMLTNIFSKNSLLPALFWKRISNEKVVLYLFFQKPAPANFVELFSNEKMSSGIQDKRSSASPNNIFNDPAIINSGESLENLLAVIKSSLKQN